MTLDDAELLERMDRLSLAGILGRLAYLLLVWGVTAFALGCCIGAAIYWPQVRDALAGLLFIGVIVWILRPGRRR